MPKLETDKNRGKKSTDERAQAARARRLRELIDQLTKEKSGELSPQGPRDFIHKKMREVAKK
jgi:hypothetical protein